MLYSCLSCGIIGVSFSSDGSGSLVFPHCVSLRYFAANYALSLCGMCFSYLSLLCNGVGVYFFFGSLIPSHLSLKSRFVETDSMILFCASYVMF